MNRKHIAPALFGMGVLTLAINVAQFMADKYHDLNWLLVASGGHKETATALFAGAIAAQLLWGDRKAD